MISVVSALLYPIKEKLNKKRNAKRRKREKIRKTDRETGSRVRIKSDECLSHIHQFDSNHMNAFSVRIKSDESLRLLVLPPCETVVDSALVGICGFLHPTSCLPKSRCPEDDVPHLFMVWGLGFRVSAPKMMFLTCLWFGV